MNEFASADGGAVLRITDTKAETLTSVFESNDHEKVFFFFLVHRERTLDDATSKFILLLNVDGQKLWCHYGFQDQFFRKKQQTANSRIAP